MTHNSYISGAEKSTEDILIYSNTNNLLSRYLAFRDIPFLLNKYVKGKNVLDFGCGLGYSTEFIHNLNYNVTGVDIDQEMLKQSKINFPHIHFHKINNNMSFIESNSFDLIFSSFVLFEISSAEKMVNYFKEWKRLLKENGAIIAITGSEYAYMISKNFLLYNNKYPENENLKSGKIVKALDNNAKIEFSAYYWTENDYKQCVKESGLHLKKFYYPLGKKEEPFQWQDELSSSPYLILVATKNN
ncbi:class I SAM-dependent methyltransferase [Silvanigrella aquatica]|uniref:Methyltransferase domain-containing protein n=1 Tax=Silvanigrella aquatica TaxID=1915309 RepID=A0A1L4D0E5_9BACT|nr:class I SAM-dependent methyltransferase [Silvanigrella aquatica]APJ03683.1 hypothetical protein AXG55_07100 [Silvanigrella aquatica]